MKVKAFFRHLLLATAILSLSACSTNRRLRKADKRYEIGEYNKAATMYRRVASSVKEKKMRADINFKMGECYREVHNLTRAASAYKKAVKYNYPEPEIFLGYADVLYAQGKIGDAKKNYQEYLLSFPESNKALNGITACDSITKWNLQTSYQIAEAKHLYSKRSSNFCPAFAGEAEDVVYFTTNREGVIGGAKMSPITGRRYNDIYVVSKNLENKWKDAEPIESVNTEFDEGTPAFTADGKTMFYTNARFEKGSSLGTSIFICERKGAEWAEATKLEIITDSLVDTLTLAHPAPSSTGLQLIFSSDLPNGYGGLDLWIVKQEGSTWSQPVNMGPEINTAGDEVFPYFRSDTAFYFSSDGHPGFGSLDIYKAAYKGFDTWKVTNMGTPINSSADDFGITFSKEKESGYFSSNRNERKGYDKIYSFILPTLEFGFQGKLIDDRTKEPIAGAVIKLVGNDGTNTKITSKKDGTYTYELKKGIDYVFLATARGYLNQSGEMNTLSANKSITHTKNFQLSSIRQPIRLNNILFDFASAELTETSKEELSKLVDVLSDNPNITIEISAHSDAIGEDEVNIKMSQKRAESVVNFLIAKNIAKDRLTAKGYGETKPMVADEAMAEQHRFMEVGDVLDEAFVGKLNDKNKDIAYGYNRRTEFKVISTTYKSKK